MRKFWFADAEPIPEFAEHIHEPRGKGTTRAVHAPEEGVKHVLAVELSTFSETLAFEAEEARSTPGMQVVGLIELLSERGVRLPKQLVDFARYRDEPGEDVTNRARTDLLVIDGVTYYASTWQMWGYQLSVTVIDEAWLTILQPVRHDVTRLVVV